MDRCVGCGKVIRRITLIIGLLFSGPILAAAGELDRSRYIPPDELKPGMKGFGRTVLSGNKIETFQLEVIGVMRNTYYAKQDVILVRCSGLNLEHSGIVRGMSGSPCYVWNESGEPKMIGAIAYGWTYNKDPVCGVQPITQMIDIAKVRSPESQAKDSDHEKKSSSNGAALRPAGGKGVSLGKVIARSFSEPIELPSRFSLFNHEISTSGVRREGTSDISDQLRPLEIPVAIPGRLAGETMTYLQKHLKRFGFMPVVAGQADAATLADARNVKIEPGSVLCVRLMGGDLSAQAVGTCTEVMDNRVLGFGHNLYGEGSVELPLATGMVHTVISSLASSFKIGAAIETVGTLWGDENTGIYGVIGKAPAMIPLEVIVDDVRGKRTFNYEVANERDLTGMLMTAGVLEGILAHSNLPREHTLHYTIETEFEGIGAFRTANTTSQDSVYGLTMDVMVPIASMMNTPFEKARVSRARVEVTVKQGARLARIDQVTLPKLIYKPGETIDARVRWFHYRRQPAYTYEKYSLTLPADLPDGKYQLTVGSMIAHLRALRIEKPHLFYAENLDQVLQGLNRVVSFPENRLYMRLILPTKGLAIKQVEMPELPSFREQIFSESKRTDVRKYTEAKVVQHETDFVVQGDLSFEIQVDRRADQ